MKIGLVLAALVLSVGVAWGSVRPPAVAGAFYPADAEVLRSQVEGFLGRSGPVGEGAPLAVIVPHAGYPFSGETAGRAFAGLRGAPIQRVILLGPSHHLRFAGGALPDPEIVAFATPLGQAGLDLEALERLRRDPAFAGPATAHGPEHSLEVELPFLRLLAPDARLVPVLVGFETDLALAAAMARSLASLAGPGTVVVASSDFTHHGSGYRWAPFPVDPFLPQRLEGLARATSGRAAAVDPRGFWAQVTASGDTVCGARPIAVLLELLAHAARASGEVVEVTTSARAGGDLRQLVTYAAVTFRGSWQGWRELDHGHHRPLPEERGRALVALARAALESHLRHGAALADWFAGNPVEGALLAPSGAFVTVNNTGERALRHGRLRGCIGAIEPREALVDAVVRAAVSAAHDPRFPDLTAAELEGVELEVSVLTPPEPVPGPESIRIGTHGIILRSGGRSAVFLPQVATEQGWDLETTLAQLARKAGLPADGWRGASFEVFTARVFREGRS